MGNEKARVHLNFLDSLRGLVALYVVIAHIYNEIDPDLHTSPFPPQFRQLSYLLMGGHFAVAFFIVLSGFCLMLPVVRSSDRQLRGGFWGYIKRRARRILPPYYASIAISLLLIAFIPYLRSHQDVRWDIVLPAFDFKVILSHLFLIHNIKINWIYKINYPMWSVATEWQIYFVFPLLLVLWRKAGIILAIICAFAISVIPHYLLNGYLDWLCPWYLGCFALGMAAATITFSKYDFKKRVNWGLMILVLSILFIGYIILIEWTPPLQVYPWYLDAFASVILGCLLIQFSEIAVNRKPSRIMEVLDSRWVVGLGRFSYSLYLTHAPILAILHTPLIALNIPSINRFVILIIGGIPACLVCAYFFFLMFERPFVAKK